ncbi:MAG: hypothetical protein HRT52_22945 [Colwellia sp.]|nr:hypothetical protein [Colwellia sp.]
MSILKYLFLLIVVSMMGCSSEEESITSIDNPELVTIAFFNAIYNENDLKKAASVCSPKLARILLHYKSSKAVGRHMFNMSYDKVEITPEDSGVKVREQFKDAAIIIVYFDGMYFDERRKDVKRLYLVQTDGKWVIEKFLKDPF